MCSCLVSQHHLLRYLFPIVYSCFLYHKLGDHSCVGLYLGFYTVPLIYISVFFFFLQLSYCLITVALKYSLKSGSLIRPVPFFFLKISLFI